MTGEIELIEEDWRSRAEQAERELTEAVAAAEQRLIRAELKAEALRAGMIDLDGIKLVEMESLTLNDKGELSGATQIMTQLKRAKP